MQKIVKEQSVTRKFKDKRRESSFLRTAKKSARRNAAALRELAKY